MKYFIIENKSKSRDQIFNDIANFAFNNKIIIDEKALVKAFINREKEVSTGFENGLAIPHARNKSIQESAIIIVRNKVGVNWPSLDQKPTNLIIALLISGNDKSSNEEHLTTLAAVSSLLIETKNIELFRTGELTKIKKLIQAKITSQNSEKTQNAKNNNDAYDLVGVTSCITGVAHTNMAAEAILKFAKANNLKAKVERQGAQGPLTPLTEKDIVSAKYVLLAIDKPIDGLDRFDNKKVLKTRTIAAIKDMPKVWKELQNANIQSFGKLKSKSIDKKARKNDDNRGIGKEKPVKVMSAIMNGLSYMIPIIIVGGIFLAFGLGIGQIALGGPVDKHHNSFWYTILQIGLAGISLAVVVLGGYVAYALGGRMVMAPAMLLAFVAQGIGMGDINYTFFNYTTGAFGVEGSNLSFFGSIAAGLLCGYAGFYWNKFVSPKIGKSLKTIEPIIIVPILFVLVGWFLFSFILYLPLYWLSVGLNLGVSALVDLNLLWIAGAIGGAMLCFDLGGPVNKIAFGLGVALIDTHPEVMGAIAAAGAVAPFGMAFGWFIGSKVFRIKSFRTNEMAKENFIPAIFMGTLGISEGAIPYAINYPKSAIISNVIGGAVAGALSGAFLITDAAAHTGPIVYVLGAIGKNGVTDYLYGLLYLLAWIVGSVVTAILFITLEWVFSRNETKKARNKETKTSKLKTTI